MDNSSSRSCPVEQSDRPAWVLAVAMCVPIATAAWLGYRETGASSAPVDAAAHSSGTALHPATATEEPSRSIDRYGILLESIAAMEIRLDAMQLGLSRTETAIQDENRRRLDLEQALYNAEEISESIHSDLEGLRTRVATSLTTERDPHHARVLRQRTMLSPVFRLSGTDAVGSATLFHHDSDANGSYYLALTCYHVVRDIFEERAPGADMHADSVTAVFDRSEGTLRIDARMVAENIAKDLAVLRIDTDRDLGPCASLAPITRTDDVEVFTPVYTVGCPLGTAPQATRGEITRTSWDVSGDDYWMVSSPAFFGNSGGGVFLEETLEFVGVFAKIYTHGSFRPQVVTHMGLVVPLDQVTQWLHEAGFSYAVPSPVGSAYVADAGHEPSQ